MYPLRDAVPILSTLSHISTNFSTNNSHASVSTNMVLSNVDTNSDAYSHTHTDTNNDNIITRTHRKLADICRNMETSRFTLRPINKTDFGVLCEICTVYE